MSIDPTGADPFPRFAAATLREHWRMLLVEGIILLVLGAIAIIVPPIATLAVEVLIGWLFLISGLVGLYTTYLMRHAPGFWWSLVSAIIAIAAGVVLIGFPVGGILSLTLILIVFFIVEGVASIMYGIEHWRETPGRWGFLIASGVVDLILAAIIFAGSAGTAAWALGLLVGINMVFGGAALIAVALHARDLGSGTVQSMP